LGKSSSHRNYTSSWTTFLHFKWSEPLLCIRNIPNSFTILENTSRYLLQSCWSTAQLKRPNKPPVALVYLIIVKAGVKSQVGKVCVWGGGRKHNAYSSNRLLSFSNTSLCNSLEFPVNFKQQSKTDCQRIVTKQLTGLRVIDKACHCDRHCIHDRVYVFETGITLPGRSEVSPAVAAPCRLHPCAVLEGSSIKKRNYWVI
jgi:hypothetical protein